MHWYKNIKIAKTLYHGTSIDNYDSIKNIGLVPDVGNFVTDSYQGEYDAANVEFDPIPLIYATDKEELDKAVTAMSYAVSKMLGKTMHSITSNELKNYGMLVIIKEGDEYMEQRPQEETGPWGDWQGETDNQYPAVEPGDYYSEDGQEGHILIGNKMESFLKQYNVWPDYIDDSLENIKKQLMTMAIRYHIKKTPQKKDKIISEITTKINQMNMTDIKEHYKTYQELIRNALV